GWEMPWWNFSGADARRMGTEFGHAFLTTLDEIRDRTVPATQENPTIDVPRWEMHEFVAKGRAHVKNPFRDAAWVAEFISPSGQTNIVDGFYDGAETWRLRFAPNE